MTGSVPMPLVDSLRSDKLTRAPVLIAGWSADREASGVKEGGGVLTGVPTSSVGRSAGCQASGVGKDDVDELSSIDRRRRL